MDAMEDVDLLSGSNTHLSKVGNGGGGNGEAAAAQEAAAVAAAAAASAAAEKPPLAAVAAPAPGGGGDGGGGGGGGGGLKSFGAPSALAGASSSSSGAPPAPAVKYRRVGKSGLLVSNVALGSTKLFSLDNPDVSESIVSAAFDAGINFFDVSDHVHQRRSEREFGRIFKKKGWRRRDYVVCTRIYWNSRDERGGLSRKEILESVKESLQNLQLEYIDLVIINKYDPNCPMEEIVRTMSYCVDTGLCLYWGSARWSPVEVYEAFSVAKTIMGVHPICELAEYHWFHREKVEVYMAEIYNKIGIGLMTWSPVSLGLCLGGTTEEIQNLLVRMHLKSYKYTGIGGGGPMGAVVKAAATADSVVGGTTTAAEAAGTVTLPGTVSGGPAAAAISGSSEHVGGVTSAGGQQQPSSSSSTSVPQGRVKQLQSVADRLGCTLNQMMVAWAVRNQTSQSCITSAATLEGFQEILDALAVTKSLSQSTCDEIDKILCNKPARPPMVSTLQQRWATTGAIPPC